MTDECTVVRQPGDTDTDAMEIHDAAGNRIGVMIGGMPVYGASDEDMADIEERIRLDTAKTADRCKDTSRGLLHSKYAELRDMADIDPSQRINDFDELTAPERLILQDACKNPSRSVALPVVVKHAMKSKVFDFTTIKAAEVSMLRAARRLFNRGLCWIVKSGGVNTVYFSEKRIRETIHRALSLREADAADNIYLIKEPCKIPTTDSDEDTGSKKRASLPPTSLPRKAGEERMAACRLMKGVRMLDETDSVELRSRFIHYLSDINEKVIALLDGKTGNLLGAEYSTRFNDPIKSKKSLDRFDYAMEQTFNDHRYAVFLTLTSDPNLPDPEAEARKREEIADLRKKLSNLAISKYYREKLEERLYSKLGPDREITDLQTVPPAILSEKQQKRLSVLLAQREAAKGLRDTLADPSAGVRKKEHAVQGLKKMNRWEYHYDPNGHQCLWDVNRSFSPAWNKFMAYVTRRQKGRRPEYITGFEYTKSGLMHAHCLIFVEYLALIDDISIEWQRLNQGQVAYIYALEAKRKRDGDGFEWRWRSAKRKPRDAVTKSGKPMSGGDYLGKYIKKATLAMMSAHEPPAAIQSPYWALNKRMWTCSRCLLPKTEKLIRSEPSSVSFFRILAATEADYLVDRMVYHRGCFRPTDDGGPGDAVTSEVPA